MELRICHLYPSLLNMYGDIGNIHILKRRAEMRGIKAFVHDFSQGDDFEGTKYDIVMLGGGQDFEVEIVLRDLWEKKDTLRDYIENEGVFLAVGSGYQILGETFVKSDGEEKEGLALLPFCTKPAEKRFVGNIAIRRGETVSVGFENHFGRTDIGSLSPLGTVLSGFGNNGEDGQEGVSYKNTVCTYLHGPFLAKSPEMADALLLKVLKQKYDIETLSPLDDTFEYRAREEMLKSLNI